MCGSALGTGLVIPASAPSPPAYTAMPLLSMYDQCWGRSGLQGFRPRKLDSLRCLERWKVLVYPHLAHPQGEGSGVELAASEVDVYQYSSTHIIYTEAWRAPVKTQTHIETEMCTHTDTHVYRHPHKATTHTPHMHACTYVYHTGKGSTPQRIPLVCRRACRPCAFIHVPSYTPSLTYTPPTHVRFQPALWS